MYCIAELNPEFYPFFNAKISSVKKSINIIIFVKSAHIPHFNFYVLKDKFRVERVSFTNFPKNVWPQNAFDGGRTYMRTDRVVKGFTETAVPFNNQFNVKKVIYLIFSVASKRVCVGYW